MSKKKETKGPSLAERMDMLELALSQLTQVVKMHHQVLEQAARDVQMAEEERLKNAGIDQARSNNTHPPDGFENFPPNCS